VQKYGGNGTEIQIVLLAQNRAFDESSVVTPDEKRLQAELERAVAELLTRTPRQQVEMPKRDVLGASMTHFGVTWLGAMETYWTGIARGVFAAAARECLY
jgi:hypothetical protein